jgi:hypothetical protein
VSQLELLYGQVLANVIAVIIVFLCWRWRVAGRLSLVALFLWAGQYNLRSAFLHPEQYLAYAQLAYFARYQQFILGFFARHTTAVVATIAVGQLAVAVLIALRGWAVYLGLAGAIVSLVAIAPLGSGAAFPSTIIAACGAILLLGQIHDATLLGALVSRKKQKPSENLTEAKAQTVRRERLQHDDPDAHLGHRGAE